MKNWTYTSERIRRHEEARKAERLKKAGRIVGGILAGVVVVALGILANTEDVRIIESLKKAHALEMSRCLEDWNADLNGGCKWEVKRFRDGTPYAVEVVARR